MAFSRRFADSDRVLEAIFNDNFGLSDEEDSESNNENDIYGYLGHSIVSRAEIIEAARDMVEEEAFETEDETTADTSVFLWIIPPFIYLETLKIQTKMVWI